METDIAHLKFNTVLLELVTRGAPKIQRKIYNRRYFDKYDFYCDCCNYTYAIVNKQKHLRTKKHQANAAKKADSVGL